MTGETIPEVLEVAHIIPVSDGGGDSASNGLCMRSDVHDLYDSGHLQVLRGGTVQLSRVARSGLSYSAFPSTISIPSYVDLAAIEWRANYQA